MARGGIWTGSKLELGSSNAFNLWDGLLKNIWKKFSNDRHWTGLQVTGCLQKFPKIQPNLAFWAKSQIKQFNNYGLVLNFYGTLQFGARSNSPGTDPQKVPSNSDSVHTTGSPIQTPRYQIYIVISDPYTKADQSNTPIFPSRKPLWCTNHI